VILIAYMRFWLPMKLSNRAVASARLVGSVNVRVWSVRKRVTAANGVRSESAATVALPSALRW
jgi:hypothetical protein